MVLDHQLAHKALAVVPGHSGSVYHILELEASKVLVPQFHQLQLQQDVILSLIGKEQLTHSVVIQVFCDGMDQLQYPSDACSSHSDANRLHHLDLGVRFLVWVDGTLSFVLVD